MLRASAQIGQVDVNLKAVSDSSLDPLLPAGPELLTFVDALISNDKEVLDQARSSLQDVAGPDAVTRAALVIGNFEMMNRLLDATGVPVPISMGGITSELGLPAFTGRH